MADKEPAKEEEPVIAKPKSGPQTDSSKVMEGIYFGTSEQTFEQSTYYPASYVKPHNPDPLIMRDSSYAIYEDMRQDDQVNVALAIKKDLVVGSGWCLLTEDEDIKKELEGSLCDDVERPLSEILEDMVQAYDFGFSLSEKIFKNLPDGRLALKNIKTRHPSTWLIHTDDQGNVERYEQRGPKGSIDVNPECLIHYVNNQRYQNPYGESDLKAAYQAYLTKRHIVRYYAIYLENAAGPKPVAKYDRRAPQNVVDDIFQSIKKFQTKTALVIPKDFDMEFLEAKNTGEPYIKGINLFNMFIGRAMFIPDLLGFSGGETGGGSHALGKEQIGLFYRHVQRRREVIERIIDQHVIRPLCIYNYGEMDTYPKFKFNALSEDDALAQGELWIKAIQGVGWQPTPEEVNHLRQIVKFPESDDLVMSADIAAQQQADLQAQGLGADPNNPDAPKPPGGPGASPAKGGPPDKSKEEDPGKTAKDSKKKTFGLGAKPPGDYHKKCDFKHGKQVLVTAVDKIMVECQPIVDDIFQDLYDQITKMKVIQKQDISKTESLRLKYLGKLQIALKKQFRGLYKDAQDMARTEVGKQNHATNIPADEFLAFLEDETFKYVGDWAYGITKKTKDLLIQAIKDGDSISNVISVLDNEGNNLSEVSLERYARTKTTEVFNRGRLEYFESTGIVEAYQFSAIMDDVTTDICADLDGVIFESGSEPVPPLHFNCRSTLIPITKFEEYETSDKTNSGENIDKFLETNVSDKGFPIN